jgi:hypothetical protein
MVCKLMEGISVTFYMIQGRQFCRTQIWVHYHTKLLSGFAPPTQRHTRENTIKIYVREMLVLMSTGFAQ